MLLEKAKWCIWISFFHYVNNNFCPALSQFVSLLSNSKVVQRPMYLSWTIKDLTCTSFTDSQDTPECR